MSDDLDELERLATAIRPDQRDTPVFSANHVISITARLREVESERDRLRAALDEAVGVLSGCQWYWPESDTDSENCCSNPAEVVEAAYAWDTPTGAVVAVARGGVIEVIYCASLPPADDSESDDDFWVEESTEEAAKAKIDAEIARRAAAMDELLAMKDAGDD